MRRRARALRALLGAELAAWLVLAIVLGATAASCWYVDQQTVVQERARFDQLASAMLDALHDRMEAYVATLRATRGVFVDGATPSRRAFAQYVRSIELERWYPGVQGIGYVEVLAPGQLARHERAVRAEGFPGYRVWPRGAREVYSAIVYLEPFDWRNQRAFGYDMMSEPTRREAMERARDSGTAACSARVELVQEAGSGRQPGFLIYLPLYSGEPRDLAGRRSRLRGFVYAPFRALDLVHATLGEEALARLHVEVYDGDRATPDALLYRSPGGPGSAGASFGRASALDVAGRRWTVLFSAPSGFATPWEVALPRVVAIVGLLCGVLLFRVTRGEERSRARAQRDASRSSFLADAGRMLASSLDYRATLAQVAERASQDQADWCAILLVESEGAVRLVGRRDVGVAPRALAALEGLLLDEEARFGAAAALATSEPFLAHDVDDSVLRRIASGPEQLEQLRAAGIQSLLTVPLRARGQSLGAVAFVSCAEARRFDAGDVAMAQDLGRLTVSAIDTARLYRRAQEAVRQRDEFLSVASHELKTPLTSLVLQTHSLISGASRGNVPAEVGRKAEVIRRNVDRLTRLIGSLLDISRIGAGRLELELEDVDLAELVREVAARFEEEAAKAGCELRLDVGAAARGRWDRLRLDQVVTNLVSNAVKYGQGQPITIALRTAEDRVVLTVRDEGIGIAPDAQQRIFERFERAVSERHYGGFGLGLWIVRRIVEALGGEVHVESDPGHGSTFVVQLKRGAADAGASSEQPRRAEEPAGEVAGRARSR